MGKTPKISRDKVGKWLDKYPRSPWWISNLQIADYCTIPGDDMMNNTTILVKYSTFLLACLFGWLVVYWFVYSCLFARTPLFVCMLIIVCLFVGLFVWVSTLFACLFG